MTRLTDSRAFVATLIICTILLSAYVVRADDTALNLVRCLRAECDDCTRPDEKEGIAWVLRKRQKQKAKVREGWSLNSQILAYCALFDRRSSRHNSPRSKAIRASTFDAPQHGTRPKDGRWWKRMRWWALSFLAGKIPDPFPMANHWGGRSDRIPPSWRVIAQRANTFYRAVHKERGRK